MNQPNAMMTRGVSVAYGSHTVLDGIDLSVPTGGVYGLLGRNGVGKSTLVRCLLGQEPPMSGSVEVMGLDPWQHRAKLMQRIGVVPESPQVPPAASAQELLTMGARLYKNWNTEGANMRLRRFSVPTSVPFRRLSKGQQKQVELALALAQRPGLLILDDPSLGLDSVARRVLYEELLDHLSQEGVTVFLTSHDLDAVERLVDTIAILDQGQLVVEEPLEQLKTRFRRVPLRPGTESASVPAPIRVKTGAWGREAIVTLDEAVAQPSPEGTPSKPPGHAMTLEEIFDSLVGANSETSNDRGAA